MHTNFLYNRVISNLDFNNKSNSVEQQFFSPINFSINFKKQLFPFDPAPNKQNNLWIG